MFTKKLLLTATLLSLMMASSVLASNKDIPMPKADAQALWTYITETSPYKQWSFWPDHQGMQPGNAPHGPLHKVHVNNQALQSTQPFYQTYPNLFRRI